MSTPKPEEAPKMSPDERVRHGLARTSRSLASLANVSLQPTIRSGILRISMELSDLEARAVAADPGDIDEDANGETF